MQPPQTQLVIPQWLALPMPVRLHLKKIFGIPRSEGTNLVDGRVVSDGHNHYDLAHITVPAMQLYLDSDEADFHKLFAMTLEKAEGELAPAPTNAEVGKHIDAPKPIMLSVGGKTYVATEVTAGADAGISIYPEDNKPLYPIAPAPVTPKKTRAKRGPNKKK